ncbi:MAG: hypothetical protein Q7S37_02275 [bacterium]|nr:hypothetical protein [bacterium]
MTSYTVVLGRKLVALRKSELVFVKQVVAHHDEYLKAIGLSMEDICELVYVHKEIPFLEVYARGLKYEFRLTLIPVRAGAASKSQKDWREVLVASCPGHDGINCKGPGRLESDSYLDPDSYEDLLDALRSGPTRDKAEPPSALALYLGERELEEQEQGT